MENTPENKQPFAEQYQGYNAQAQPYGADEMPQSIYPQPGATSSTPGEQAYSEYSSYGQQPPHTAQGYGQQQQQYYGQQQQQYGQPRFGTYQQGLDAGPLERTGMGIKAQTAAVLSYVFGWVGGLVILLLERENRYARFNAMQSLLFFGALGIAQWTVGYMPSLGFLRGALGIITFVGWIFLIVTASKGRYYKLPAIGELAEQFLTKFH
jgi:uncharacterized membrane protein